MKSLLFVFSGAFLLWTASHGTERYPENVVLQSLEPGSMLIFDSNLEVVEPADPFTEVNFQGGLVHVPQDGILKTDLRIGPDILFNRYFPHCTVAFDKKGKKMEPGQKVRIQSVSGFSRGPSYRYNLEFVQEDVAGWKWPRMTCVTRNSDHEHYIGAEFFTLNFFAYTLKRAVKLTDLVFNPQITGKHEPFKTVMVVEVKKDIKIDEPGVLYLVDGKLTQEEPQKDKDHCILRMFLSLEKGQQMLVARDSYGFKKDLRSTRLGKGLERSSTFGYNLLDGDKFMYSNQITCNYPSRIMPDSRGVGLKALKGYIEMIKLR